MPDLVEWDYGNYEGHASGEIRAAAARLAALPRRLPGRRERRSRSARARTASIARVRAVAGDVLLFSSGHILRILAARWLGLEPAAGGRKSSGSTPRASSAVGYDHDRSRARDPALERRSPRRRLNPHAERKGDPMKRDEAKLPRPRPEPLARQHHARPARQRHARALHRRALGDRADVEPDDLRPRDQEQHRLRRGDPRKADGRASRGEELFFELALEDLTRAADLFRPIHERTRRRRRLGLARGLAAARHDAADHARGGARTCIARAAGPTCSSRSPARPKGCRRSRRRSSPASRST